MLHYYTALNDFGHVLVQFYILRWDKNKICCRMSPDLCQINTTFVTILLIIINHQPSGLVQFDAVLFKSLECTLRTTVICKFVVFRC